MINQLNKTLVLALLTSRSTASTLYRSGKRMVIEDDQIDRDRFDEHKRGKWKREYLEAFRCGHCRMLFIGAPDCHALLTNGQTPCRWRTYNRPQGTKCPECGGRNQGAGAQAFNVRSLSELRGTTWNWLFKQR